MPMIIHIITTATITTIIIMTTKSRIIHPRLPGDP